MISRGKEYLSGGGLGPVLIKAVTGSGFIRVVGMGFGFLVGIQLARGLGPSGYGIYGLVMAFISILAVPVEFGIPSLLTREVAANLARSRWGEVRGVLAWAQRTVLLSFAVILLLALSVGWFLSDRIDQKILLPGVVGLFYIPLAASANLRSAALRGLQQLVKGDLPDGLVRPAIYSALLALVSIVFGAQLSPVVAIALQLLAVGAACLFSAHLLKGALPGEFCSFSPVTSKRVWRRAAFPMAMSEGLRIVQAQFPVLVLGWMVPVGEVGIFRVASSMIVLLGMPMTLLNVIAGPVVAKLYTQGDRVRLQRFLTWTALVMSASVFIVSLPFLIAGAPIVRLLFGAQFEAASVPLAILVAGFCVNAACGVGVVTLNMTGHHVRVSRLFTISLVVLVVLAVSLSWIYGVNGAAAAAAISMALFGILAWREVRLHLQFDASVFGILRR